VSYRVYPRDLPEAVQKVDYRHLLGLIGSHSGAGVEEERGLAQNVRFRDGKQLGLGLAV
jgi:hypothetical protein